MRISVTILLIILSLPIWATEQTPDILIYKSDIILIDSYPLEDLMEKDSIVENKILDHSEDLCMSSDCWRGHIATWEIENDSLFLTSLKDGCDEKQLDINRVLGQTANTVFADWYTGEIIEYESWFAEEDENHNLFKCKVINGKVTFLECHKFPVHELINAFNKNTNDNDTAIHIIVDKKPVLMAATINYELPELKYFILENIKYPQNEIDCSGSVYISFIVEKNGTVSNKKFEQKLCEGYDEEAMKVVDLMINWKPGLINGNPVRTKITLPLRYRYE